MKGLYTSLSPEQKHIFLSVFCAPTLKGVALFCLLHRIYFAALHECTAHQSPRPCRANKEWTYVFPNRTNYSVWDHLNDADCELGSYTGEGKNFLHNYGTNYFLGHDYEPLATLIDWINKVDVFPKQISRWIKNSQGCVFCNVHSIGALYTPILPIPNTFCEFVKALYPYHSR